MRLIDKNVSLNIPNGEVEETKCSLCGYECDEDYEVKRRLNIFGDETAPICDRCYENSRTCVGCGTVDIYVNRKTKGVYRVLKTGEILCPTCRKIEKEEKTCSFCNKQRTNYIEHNKKIMCTTCLSSHYFKCSVCTNWHPKVYNVFYSSVNRHNYPTTSKKYNNKLCTSCASKVPELNKPEVGFENCACCGKLTDKNIIFEGKKVYVCNAACLNKLYVCDDCGAIHKDRHIYSILDNSTTTINKHLCVYCRDTYIYSCPYCNNISKDKNNFHKDRHCLICEKNKTKCQYCGDLSIKVVPYRGDKNLNFCSKCNDSVIKCSICNKLHDYPYGDFKHCPKCYSKEYNALIKFGYSFSPRLFHKHYYDSIDTYNILLGVENEVIVDNAKAVSNLVYAGFGQENIYIVHDGSIIDSVNHKREGLELVFHPRTTKSYQEFNYKNLWDNVKKDISCGMHVHLDRSKFYPTHIYRFTKFIHDNPNFIRVIAQRNEQKYCEKPIEKTSSFVLSDRRDHDNRYKQVNLTNKKTIEVRIFAGVESKDMFLKNVEFCDALYNFTKDINIKDLTLTNFISYIVTSTKYTNLVSFVKKYTSLILV